MATICLAMIVKDEAHVLRRCLESAKGIVSSYVILDTGSSRETFLEQQKIILDVLGPEGEYSQVEWEGFAGTRNKALRLGRGRADYILSLDADEVLVKTGETALDAPLYSIAVTPDNEVFNWRELLIASSCPATWDGDIHEHLVSIHKPVKLEGMHIFHHADGARANNPEKHKTDRESILTSMAKCDDKAEWERLCFMLGDNYLAEKMFTKAEELYNSMADTMPNGNELVWNAIYRVGILREMRSDEHHRIIAAYKRAIDTRPYRIEPYLALADYLRRKGDKRWAQEIMQAAMNINDVPPDTYCVDNKLYTKDFKDKFMAQLKGDE